jgi:hypothetical protein
MRQSMNHRLPTTSSYKHSIEGVKNMVEKNGIYETAKARVRTIQEAYDALIEAAVDYKAWVEELIAQCDPSDEQDKHLSVVANLQRNTTNGMINTLDTDLHDDLIRLSDRVIRYKHWEDGVFV